METILIVLIRSIVFAGLFLLGKYFGDMNLISMFAMYLVANILITVAEELR